MHRDKKLDILHEHTLVNDVLKPAKQAKELCLRTRRLCQATVGSRQPTTGQESNLNIYLDELRESR